MWRVRTHGKCKVVAGLVACLVGGRVVGVLGVPSFGVSNYVGPAVIVTQVLKMLKQSQHGQVQEKKREE